MNRRNIIIGVVIVIVIYLLYLWLFADSGRTALSGMRNAEHEHTISGHKLPAGASSDYTYSIWLFISNWNYRIGQEKVVFERKDKGGYPAPRVSLGKNLNNVIVTLATYPHKGNGGNQEKPVPHSCVLENVPLQAWVNVILTLNNRALDLYLDGKLVRTCVLPGVPLMSSGKKLVIAPSESEGRHGKHHGGSGGGFNGHISNFQYFSRAVNPREAYAIYREGPGGDNWLSNVFNKYRLKIAFMKDNKEVNSFEI